MYACMSVYKGGEEEGIAKCIALSSSVERLLTADLAMPPLG